MGDAAGGWAGIEGLLALRARLHAWVAARDGIDGAVAFGSTERSDRPADDWSDLDLLFAVSDVAPWLDDLAWTDEIGETWLRFVHPAPVPGVAVVQVLFAGGYDVDLVPLDGDGLSVLELPEVRDAVVGAGARIVRPGSSRLEALAAAGATPAGVEPPSEAAFRFTVDTFLYQVAWATKRLRRGERWRAWDDHADYLRKRHLAMLEWQALARGTPGVFPDGRKLERWVDAPTAEALPGTFAGYDDASLAAALPRLFDAFTGAAREVAAAYGLSYPADAEREIRAWVSARLAETG